MKRLIQVNHMVLSHFFKYLLVVGVLIQCDEQNSLDTQSSNEPSIPLVIDARWQHLDSIDPASQYINQDSLRQTLYEPLFHLSDGLVSSSHVINEIQETLPRRRFALGINPSFRYSDGTSLGVEDVALAIKRALLAGVTNRTLNRLEGLMDWLSESQNLLVPFEGVTVEGSQIILRFQDDVEQVQEAFSGFAFGVIPANCIDLRTAQLTCTTPAASGKYSISKWDKDEKRLLLNRNKHYPRAFQGPESFEVQVACCQKLDKALQMAESSSRSYVFFTVGRESLTDLVAAEERFRVSTLPKIYTNELLLNPAAPGFAEPRCRALFAREFHEMYQRTFDAPSSGFTKFLLSEPFPGHVDDAEAFDILDEIIGEDGLDFCREHLQDKTFFLAKTRLMKTKRAVVATAVHVGFTKIEMLSTHPVETLVEMYKTGRVSAKLKGFTFDASNVMADLRDSFYRSEHQRPYYHARNSDKIARYLDRAVNSKDEMQRSESLVQFNKQLVRDAIAVYYFRRGDIIITNKQRPHRNYPINYTLLPYYLIPDVDR